MKALSKLGTTILGPPCAEPLRLGRVAPGPDRRKRGIRSSRSPGLSCQRVCRREGTVPGLAHLVSSRVASRSETRCRGGPWARPPSLRESVSLYDLFRPLDFGSYGQPIALRLPHSRIFSTSSQFRRRTISPSTICEAARKSSIASVERSTMSPLKTNGMRKISVS